MKKYGIVSNDYAEYFGFDVDSATIITEEDVINIANGDSDEMSRLYDMLTEL